MGKIGQMSSKKKQKVSQQLSSPTAVSLPPPRKPLPPHQAVLAPMVGGSELAFRLLARRHGAQLCYTPMIYSNRFVDDEAYRRAELRSCAADAPLVAHFCGNEPKTLLRAARLAEPHVAAVDLNLGCPQRVAHAGHFGSYLLDECDRPLVLSIVRTLATHLRVPVFCKIRLLDELEETLRFCGQLREAGCALIAVHARYRGSATRRRDGPAHLEQVAAIKQALGELPVLSNGNVREAADVLDSLSFTAADGVMSAEGALDHPALFHHAAVRALPMRKRLRKQLRQAKADTAAGDACATKLKHLRAQLRPLVRVPPPALREPPSSLVGLALEYLDLVDEHSAASPLSSVRHLVEQLSKYEAFPESYVPDSAEERKRSEQAVRASDGGHALLKERSMARRSSSGWSTFHIHRDESCMLRWSCARRIHCAL
mmetsp:Transcript_15347/g.35334  ORF Transcript_15347/g.35334 Transcript_15347/m.35334 type:complete len:428 (-) Transcript_15347:1147-2430(-)